VTTNRQTLVSSGEHIYAVRRLGETYSVEAYLEAVELARDAGEGECYADRVLGATDFDALLRGVEDDGEAIVRAAESDLRARGIDPTTATYREYAEALSRVSR